MALPTVTVLGADGVTPVNVPVANAGRQDAANAAGVVLSNDDKAIFDEVNARLGPTNQGAAGGDTATSGIVGLLKRLLQRTTVQIDTFGAPDNAAWESGNGTVIGLLKAAVAALLTPATSVPPRAISTTAELTRVPFSIAGADTDTVIAADADEKLHIVRGWVYVSGATTLTFEDAQGDVSLPVPGEGIITFDFCEHPHFSTAVNVAFSIAKSTAVNCQGWFDYKKAA
jgi:hypothetical protein